MAIRTLKIILIISLILISGKMFAPLNAQIGPPGDLPFDISQLPIQLPTLSDYMTLRTFPENPGPDQKVTVNLELYLTDLNKAEISWFLNGELQKSGVGDKSFQFQTGSVGATSRVSVSVNTFEGEEGQKEIFIRPAEVNILWNADTYTPPFYRGRASFTNQSEVTLIALPNIVNAAGNQVSPQNLVYRWHRGGTFLSNFSGFGKNTLTLKGGVLLRAMDVRLEVKTLDESVTAENRITIPLVSPEILIYENHPLQGILFNRALSDFVLEERELKLSAIPFFFSVPSKNSADLEYRWSQNNSPISAPDQPSEIILRQTDEAQTGLVNIGLRATDRKNSFSRGERGVRITIEN